VRPGWDRAVVETALIVSGLLVLVAFLPHALAGDDKTRFADIEQLLHHGHASDSRYSLVMPLLSAPFLLLGEIVGSPAAWAARFNVLVVALGLLVAFRLLRGRIDHRLLRTAALVLLAASFLTNRLRDYDAEVLTTTLVVLGLIAVTTGQRPKLGWVAVIIGVVNVPATIAGLALVAAARAFRTKRFAPFLSVLVAASLIMAEAWIRRGGPLTSGYHDDQGIGTVLPYSGKPGFSYPFILGVASILFSFGRGLAFYTPGLLFGLGAGTKRTMPAKHLVGLLFLFLAGIVLVYARWWGWYGGLSWGPRYLLFAVIPASLLIAVRLRDDDASRLERLLTLSILTLSAWVGVIGAVADFSQEAFCTQKGYQLEFVCWYVPDYSSLWWPVLHFPTLTTSTAIVVGYCASVFCYLAAPLFATLIRDLASSMRATSWASGWRF
jgi:hypothetical protein